MPKWIYLRTMIILTITILIFINIRSLLTFTPLTLGLNILIRALILSLLFNSLIPSWLTIIMFLIYIGGLIILFSYFLAIQPNQHLSIRRVRYSLLISRLPIILIMPLHYFTPTFLSSFPYTSIIALNSHYIIFITIGVILFIILVIASKITSPKSGALRPFI